MIDVLRILAAPLVWLGAFSAVYGLHGLGCSMDWAAIEFGGISLFRVAMLAGWLAALLAQAALLAALHSARFGAGPGFVRGTSRATGWVGLVATAWTLMPVATTSACV